MYIYIYKYNFKSVLKSVHFCVYLHVRAELDYLTIIISFYLSLFMCTTELEDRHRPKS